MTKAKQNPHNNLETPLHLGAITIFEAPDEAEYHKQLQIVKD